MQPYEVLRATKFRWLNEVIGWIDERVFDHQWYWLCRFVSADFWGWVHDHWETKDL